MTIKTWQERLEESAHRLPSGALHTSVEEIEDAMQAEIDELRERLEAWEKQEPVLFYSPKSDSLILERHHEGATNKVICATARTVEFCKPLIAKPKEQHDRQRTT